VDYSVFDIVKALSAIVALIIAIIGHEIMHGKVAWYYGDDTALNAGRLSLNPIVHVDIIGTIVLPLILFISNMPFIFGWAKPVPIDVKKVVKNGGYNAAIAVSAAGIAYNFTIAVASSIILSFLDKPDSLLGAIPYMVLVQLIIYNTVLGIFNLWPIPQFDGSHILRYLFIKFGLDKAALLMQKAEPYGMIIVVIILATPAGVVLFEPVRFLLNNWLLIN